ncbi:hypothetical protein [Pectobacterium polaris]|uniref:pyocin knob domain-containing protein n=1 Tax=Pectobacterium polaris TaxID=2042057 RepID=UPI002B24932B|nr:hypothetical protein [Pectobacterium polaris]
MANLPEQKEWIDGIYQLETSDPVIGGPGGISNRQAEQLANRTGYLKEQQEKTGADLQTHVKAADPHTQYAPKASPALTGTPTAPTAAAGVNNAQIATTAYVMAAIAALVNGSPGALDTLKELATALGNDPNFSTTILNKLAQKLEKEQNGADIPDKAKFMANVGLKSAATRAVGTGASDIPDITTGDGRYLGKTATAAAATKLAAARKIAGVAFDGSADITLTPASVGALPIAGGTLTGALISTVADALRMVYGGYGAIFRQDGGGFYILLTNKDAANGAFNSLRPLRIDLATGNIEFGHTANAAVLQEKGQRVYSPNNKPSAADIGALPANGTAAAATKLSMARKIAGVTFDGTADIALTPANIGALPAAGTAVAATKLAVARKIAGVAFDGSADIDINTQGVFATSLSIGNAVDLNTYTSPGLYHQAANVQAASGKNYPEAQAGSLEVLKHAGITQIYRIYNNSRCYKRSQYSGVWSAWVLDYDTENKPTAADVGALPAGGTAIAATKLATARTINGVAFDGTASISLTPANIGALPAAGTAAAATKLATPRKINGVAFDGTADISLTPANIGALPAAGTAAAATKLATPRKINGVAFDGTSDIDLNGSRVWISGEYTPAASTPIVVSHGLGGINPLNCRCDVLVKCVVAEGEYRVGEFAINPMTLFMQQGVAHPYSLLPALNAGTVQLNIMHYLAASFKTSTIGNQQLNMANWRCILRIFY